MKQFAISCLVNAALVLLQVLGLATLSIAEEPVVSLENSSPNLRGQEQTYQQSNPMLMNNLFQGDIITYKQQVSEVFGEELAEKLEAAGILKEADLPEPDNSNRNLGLMTTYKNLWITRDGDNKVVVHYLFHQDVSSNERVEIVKALSDIESKTGVIKFKPRDSENDYILFKNNESGCWSNVGRMGGLQEINLANGCVHDFIIQHEVFHALGFWHEQSRQDRDNYVTILTNNIISGMAYNFAKESTNSLGSPYDYGSIMHYVATAFGKLEDFKCSQMETTNEMLIFSFSNVNVDSGTQYCIAVKDGNTNLFEGQNIILIPCGNWQNSNFRWIVESFGAISNVFRFGTDPSYCLTLDFDGVDLNSATFVVRKCIEGIFTKQQLIFDQKSWSNIRFRLGGYFDKAVTLHTTAIASQTYTLKLGEFGENEFAFQSFAANGYSIQTGRSSQINVFCQYYPLTTIDGKGNVLGGTALTTNDILQLQLMYQCPSGPRQLSNFCTTECKCKENQGNCATNAQCENGLRCVYDGISINRCINSPTKAPTKAPSKSPTAPTAPTAPTLQPVAQCIHTSSKKCKNDTKCYWMKINGKNQCVPFECKLIINPKSCKKDKKRCIWSNERKLCVPI